MIDQAEPIFYAQAEQRHSRDGSSWVVSLREDYAGRTILMTERVSVGVAVGYLVEAWRPLEVEGWVVVGQPIITPTGMAEVRVEPPDADDVKTVTPAQRRFVRRCQVRRVPAIAAVQAWDAGETDPERLAEQYHRENTRIAMWPAPHTRVGW
jgi:hypothetical protein